MGHGPPLVRAGRCTMRKWLITAAAMLALTACSGTMPSSSNSGSASGVEVFGTVDSGVSRTW